MGESVRESQVDETLRSKKLPCSSNFKPRQGGVIQDIDECYHIILRFRGAFLEGTGNNVYPILISGHSDRVGRGFYPFDLPASFTCRYEEVSAAGTHVKQRPSNFPPFYQVQDVLKELIPASRKLIKSKSVRVIVPIEAYRVIIGCQYPSMDKIAMRTTKIPPRCDVKKEIALVTTVRTFQDLRASDEYRLTCCTIARHNPRVVQVRR
jgi:hypothetical protein